MTKAIKISPNGHAIVVDDMHYDPDYIDNSISGYSLCLPQFWKHQKYSLSVFMLDKFDDHHLYNYDATRILRNLNSADGPNDDVVFGFMFICNEDIDKEIDMTMEDYEYILDHLKDIEYRKRHDISDWENILNNLE